MNPYRSVAPSLSTHPLSLRRRLRRRRKVFTVHFGRALVRAIVLTLNFCFAVVQTKGREGRSK